MDTTTSTTPSTSYTIEPSFEEDGYFEVITNNGLYLRDKDGNVRLFKTRNSARKRIARERSGNLHR